MEQDLLLYLEVGDIERRLSAARQSRAEVFQIEIADPRNIDIGDPSLDKAKGDDAIGNVLIGDYRARINIAALDIKAGEATTDFFEIVDSDELADKGCDDPLHCRVVEQVCR